MSNIYAVSMAIQKVSDDIPGPEIGATVDVVVAEDEESAQTMATGATIEFFLEMGGFMIGVDYKILHISAMQIPAGYMQSFLAKQSEVIK